MTRKYSQVKFMTHSQLQSIVCENYNRGRNGHDYFDQIEEIKDRLYRLTEKKHDEMIRKREKEEFEYLERFGVPF